MVKITREKAYQRTLRRNEEIKAAGYNLAVRWEHETPRPWWNDRLPKRGMRRSLMQLYMILNPIKIQQKELWQHKI